MQSELLKNFIKLFSANAVAQLIGIIVYPILCRIYLPEDFGLLNIFLSIGGVLVILATAEYQNAVLLPKTENMAVACVYVGSIVALSLSALLALTIPLGDYLESCFEVHGLSLCLVFLPAYVLFMALWNMLNMWYTRQGAFDAVCGYQLSKSSLSAFLKWLFSFAFVPQVALIFASVAGAAIPFAGNIFVHKKHNVSLLSCRWNDIKQAARDYSNFPKFTLPQTLVNYISGNVAIFVLSPYFSLAEVGFYSMAQTLAFQPISMISASVYQVLFNKITLMKRASQSLAPFVLRFVARLSCIVVPVFIALFFVVQPLCSFLLGDIWIRSGVFIQVMLPWIAMSLITGCLSFIPDLYGFQKKAMVIEVAYFILRLLALAYGVMCDNIVLAVGLNSAVASVVFAYQVFWYYSICKSEDAKCLDA
ncbi:MAG: oligosaccharide flippase family protein [Bacteroidales bacterium]|nr:oligosaccharide flippase family protein [Bacteroidales bacterium]